MGAPRTLALFLRALDKYQALQRVNFYARARLYGFSVAEYNARNDADTQLGQIQECVRSPEGVRPKALFIHPVNEASLQGVAREAARLGIGWVSLNRSCDYVTDLRREYGKVPLFCVDPDQRQAGRLQGQHFRILLPMGGDVLYIHGPLSTSSARLRMTGVEAELAGSSVRLISQGGDWSVESGQQAVTNWLPSNRRPWSECIIGAQNDSMALGAYKALLEEATEKKRPELLAIRITGCDGLPDYGQRFVVEGLLAATVVIPATSGTAVDQVAAALDNGRPPGSDVTLAVASFPELDELERNVRKNRDAAAAQNRQSSSHQKAARPTDPAGRPRTMRPARPRDE
jgi:ABC-type sugar transport system substrate-binding protein